MDNHKRIERIYREEKLQVRRRRRKRMAPETERKPIQNAVAESFNGRFRDGRLNENWFFALPETREIVETWRVGYNTQRPHGSIGRIPPAEFLRRFKKTEQAASELFLTEG